MNEYYNLDQLPDSECTIKLKDNPHKCGNCKYLISKDIRHNEGTCIVTRVHRCFTDHCVREEEKS